MSNDIDLIRRHSGSYDWTYPRIRPYLRTGDIVLCEGEGLISGLIRLFTRSPASHIGDIIRTSYEVQFFHSGYSKAVKGVQLEPFGEYARRYKGKISVRFLHCNRNRQWYELLHKFIEERRGTSYEKGPGGLLELLGTVFRMNRQNEKQMFCSEKEASLWKLWGYLPRDIPSNNYQPKDWLPGGKVDTFLRSASVILPGSVWLGPMQRIVK